MANKSALDRLMEQLDDIYEYRNSDPRRARYLRDRLYAMTLELIGKNDSGLTKDKMASLATTALQAEDISIAPLPQPVGSVHRA